LPRDHCLFRLGPEQKIRVPDLAAQTCIASWRRDVLSTDEASAGLSECAWDGMTLGFRYLLADIISLRQDDPQLIEKIIEFSRFYLTLHAVVASQGSEGRSREEGTLRA
jgi:hypothetical protein